jgi:hypothetical protein
MREKRRKRRQRNLLAIATLAERRVTCSMIARIMAEVEAVESLGLAGMVDVGMLFEVVVGDEEVESSKSQQVGVAYV